MSDYDVAIVGDGRDTAVAASPGVGMADHHARSYVALDSCSLRACANSDRERAERFAARHGITGMAVFTEYEELLAAADPDVLSVCVPPAERARVVAGAARTGVPDVIHCQGPVATTWADTRRVRAACDRGGVSLSVNQWRRFATLFQDAKALLDDGAIGPLQRVECDWGGGVVDAIPAIDVCNYFDDDRPAEWVIAQRDAPVAEGGPREPDSLFATWEYDDGVRGMAGPTSDTVDHGDWRLVGADGFIEVDASDELAVRVRGANGNTTKRYDRPAMAESGTASAIADVIEALETGRRSELRSTAFVAATEMAFAGQESVRRRGRVDLPLRIDDRDGGDGGAVSGPQPGDD